MVLSRETQIYRQDAELNGTLLTPAEREKLLKPYLPLPPQQLVQEPEKRKKKKKKPVRGFLKSAIHLLLYHVIHAIFSVYIRIRKAYRALTNKALSILYYHHRTPELIRKDVRNLSRLPQHVSIILELRKEERGEAGLDILLDELAEVSAWCACVGIPTLSVYERSGVLKDYIPAAHKTIATKLHAYFGKTRPSLQLRAPHMQAFMNGDFEEQEASSNGLGHLSVLLISSSDSRPTMVDLTKTLAEMSQSQKLSPADIGYDLVDAELSDSVMGEPDILVLFSPTVKLQGYPPWQVRLTEIFHVEDNTGVEYLVWLKALHRFAKAQMRFGR